MALPRIIVHDRCIVLLSGFDPAQRPAATPREALRIRDRDKLEKSLLRDKDAVAFGYVAGRWIAAA